MEDIVEFTQYFRKYTVSTDSDGRRHVSYHGNLEGVFVVQVNRTNKMYRIGHSLTNTKDNFDRVTGTNLARSRMFASAWISCEDFESFGVSYETLVTFSKVATEKSPSELMYSVRETDGSMRGVYKKPTPAGSSPPTYGVVMPYSMRNFYLDILVPRMQRILSPRIKKTGFQCLTDEIIGLAEDVVGMAKETVGMPR